MHLWIKKISAKLDHHLRDGGRDTDEWIWETMINDFAQNFQDIMSQERAQKQLFELCMERGELDDYTSKYQQCYVLGERSARLERDGYDFVVWHAALEACASSTL